MHYQHLTIENLGHDSISIQTIIPKPLQLYFDPYKLPSGKEHSKADLLFITHEHFDHCSIEDIRKIIKKETIIITVPDNQSKLASMEVATVKLMQPGKTIEQSGLSITAVPAYNTNKHFHPKENEWVGFIVDIAGVRVYVAGDTDLIPEMKTFPHVDIAFLPVSGTYVMTAEEAAQAASIMKPKLCIPMHYGSIVGTKTDAERFIALVRAKGLQAELL